eukprot:5164722-Amphidinium_carterae.1
METSLCLRCDHLLTAPAGINHQHHQSQSTYSQKIVVKEVIAQIAVEPISSTLQHHRRLVFWQA